MSSRACGRRRPQAGIWLHAGSFAELSGDHRYNTLVVIDPSGDVVATYRKQHLFGWEDGEPSVMTAGDALVVLPTPLGATGLATGYDLRFPELYRRLVDSGTESPHGVGLADAADRALDRAGEGTRDREPGVGRRVQHRGTHHGVLMGGRSIVVDLRGAVVARPAWTRRSFTPTLTSTSCASGAGKCSRSWRTVGSDPRRQRPAADLDGAESRS